MHCTRPPRRWQRFADQRAWFCCLSTTSLALTPGRTSEPQLDGKNRARTSSARPRGAGRPAPIMPLRRNPLSNEVTHVTGGSDAGLCGQRPAHPVRAPTRRRAVARWRRIEPAVPLDAAQRRLSGALMRVNHVGEVCAQALYNAQTLATERCLVAAPVRSCGARGVRPPGLDAPPAARTGRPHQRAQSAVVRRRLRHRAARRAPGPGREPGLRGRNRAPGRTAPAEPSRAPAAGRPRVARPSSCR